LSHLGEYLIQCGRRTYHAKIGDFVFIQKGITHNYKSSSKGGKVLVISPAGLEKYFKLLIFFESVISHGNRTGNCASLWSRIP
jgi:hypothetical protein